MGHRNFSVTKLEDKMLFMQLFCA